MKNILFYIWQLPQNLIGLAYMSILNRKGNMGNVTGLTNLLINDKLKYKDILFVLKRNSRGSVSLGNYIFVSQYANPFNTTIAHEVGHTKQSKILGWLYLPVIGLPSILWAGLRRLGLFKSKSYYWFYTEAWADKIAMIDRNSMYND